MDKLVRSVKQKYPQVCKVEVFSDGPSSQFKNKFAAHFLHKLRKSVDLTWHYFATSHGKGAVDGIGGTVKRDVWNAFSTRKVAAVGDAESFAKVATRLCKGVKVTFVSSKEIDAHAKSIDLERCFCSAPVIHGITKFHGLKPINNGLIRCHLYSWQSTGVDKGVSNDQESDVSDDPVNSGEQGKESDEENEGSEDESEDKSEDESEENDNESENESDEEMEDASEDESEEESDNENEQQSEDECEDESEEERENEKAEKSASVHSPVQIPVQVESYYAVKYEKKYYIGRALAFEHSKDFVKFKFLHTLGADKFDLPKTDEIEVVHISRVFYGPVSLQDRCPFTLPRQYVREIGKIYSAVRKQRKVLCK